MRTSVQNSLLVAVSLLLGLALVEGALRIKGDFADLASQDLIGSTAIWERPPDAVETFQHPDLQRRVQIRFDADGVRNHTDVATSRKHNIVGFFGDSFVENRRIEDRFSFTTVLDQAAIPAGRVVNYGVDGYGLDQSYLRYRKYRMHDIRHVVYVFCDNDLRNLYETGLVELAADGDVAVREAGVRPLYRVLGRLHTTYLVLTAYYRAAALFRTLRPDENAAKVEWFVDLKAQRARFHDRIADAVVEDFLSASPGPDTLLLARKFLLLARKWKRELEAEGRTFTVLVLPRAIDAAVAAKLLREFDGRVVQTHGHFGDFGPYAFKTDYHWNEYGNLKIAEFLASHDGIPFRAQLRHSVPGERLKREIDAYYGKP